MRKCSKCFIEKEQHEFKKDSRCPTGYTGVCKKCHKALDKIYPTSALKLKASRRRYYEKNKESRNALAAQYKKENPEWIRKWRNEYQRNRRNSDPLFKASQNMRIAIRRAFKSGKLPNRIASKNLLGCSYEELVAHIQSKFKDGMSWINIGSWQIDHIIPLSSAKNMDELHVLFNYKNIQPLWPEENIKKGSKLIAV